MNKKLISIFFRYLIILLVSLGNLKIFYLILTPATVSSLKFFLLIFGNEVVTISNKIITSNFVIELIPACVAGSAFFLLTILIFSTANIKTKVRINVLLISLASLFILNLIRILVLVNIYGSIYFESVHWIFWNVLSTLLVVAIWLTLIKIYKIKSIPVYTDVRYLFSLIKKHKKPKTKPATKWPRTKNRKVF